MCGIVGIVTTNDEPVSGVDLRSMAGSIAHRGPDDDGFFLSRSVGLGMRRLSIIDLDSGKQPISNEDGTVWIVFNGEIYNYKEIRRDLERRGHRFSTSTDTEVIVHLYEENGAECVQQLRGMFGFAIWDSRLQRLLLARDRFGIKPLYYSYNDGKLIFASELKAILQIPEIPRELNWASVNHLFTFLSTPPAESIISGIHKLEAGHTLFFGRDTPPRTQRYWKLEFEPNYSKSEEALAAELKDRFAETVSLHMVSDVPVGAFLSGGVDSASVVAQMARISSTPVKTFSIGFREAGYNELKYARIISQQYATQHFELTLDPDVLEVLEEITWHLDEPFGDSSAIPTYMVSKLAAQHVKVVLSGDGGDELFGGYDKYVIAREEQKYDPLPNSLRSVFRSISSNLPPGMKGRNFLYHLSLGPKDRYLDSVTLFRSRDREQLFSHDAVKRMRSSDPYADRRTAMHRPGQHWLSTLQALDCDTYLPLDILTKVDRMSMAQSLEVRPPLLDHKFAEFVATIPPAFLIREGQTKYIFKKAMNDLVPSCVLTRPKQGFAVPLDSWFRGKTADYAREILLSERSRSRGIFRPEQVNKLLKNHAAGKNIDLHLWTMISFELWMRSYIDCTSIPSTSSVERSPCNASAVA